ncbi:TPA: hypothetical protein L4A36_003291 [Pseudomonas aeruginosa]|uniref:hypothetical protein n=1 Tax=Pseudomonas aeruginosa TaxID=287 RepID=UPI000E30E220|nr:hypothetical protein [Pseudomonas aeruginosa]NPZ89561.1 hypothetical protein [Pseudomonas aeruginosa]HBO0185136.1 hypothetical protein [Pseudomonas aeruginosa]
MAKTNAQRQREKRQRQREAGIPERKLPSPPAIDAAFERLQVVGEFEDWREAFSTLILSASALPDADLLPLLVVSRHEYTPSENVSRQLLAAGLSVADDEQ